MEINVRDGRKIVEVWLTNQEKQDELLQKQLENLCQQYGKKKYFVIIFLSGNQDLVEETSALLCYNRKRSAEQEVQKREYARQEKQWQGKMRQGREQCIFPPY